MASWVPSVKHWLVFSCIFVTHHMVSNARLLQQFWSTEPKLKLNVSFPYTPAALDSPVKYWSDFGVQQHTLVGKWHNETYQATIWLRTSCTNSSSDRVARLLVMLNSVPHLEFERAHLTTSFRFLKDDKLPELRFMSSTNETDQVSVPLQYWKALLEWKWQTSVFSGKAILKADTVYTLTMEGSDRELHIYPHACSANPLAQPGDVWVGMTEVVYHGQQSPYYKFALLQHMQHHLKLGVRGTMMVVTPETAMTLLADPDVAAYVKRQQLVLILWDYGLVKGHPYMIQVPGNNLLKLALSGTGAMLGLWDVDEYLVLPRHNNISYEVTQGCLKNNLFSQEEQEGVIPMTATYIPDTDQPDIDLWSRHGSFEAAVKKVGYTSRAYAHCNFGIVCKAIINPDADHNMHVHQMVRRPRRGDKGRPDCRKPIPRDCAYMHHFYNMFRRRSMWGEWATSEKVFPLPLKDLPQ